MAVRFARRAPTLGFSLSVAAFNLSAAVGTWAAALSLSTTLGVTGPLAVATVVVGLALIPAVALTVAERRTHGDSSASRDRL